MTSVYCVEMHTEIKAKSREEALTKVIKILQGISDHDEDDLAEGADLINFGMRLNEMVTLQ